MPIRMPMHAAYMQSLLIEGLAIAGISSPDGLWCKALHLCTMRPEFEAVDIELKHSFPDFASFQLGQVCKSLQPLSIAS